MRVVTRYTFFLFFCWWGLITGQAQTANPVGKDDMQTRELRYQPAHHDFVITNGPHRFNRALYGSHSAFRVEAGDLPEFALYMPRMGGTFKLGLIKGELSKWLINAENIEARYQAGTMFYAIDDSILGAGKLYVQVLALPDADGMTMKIVAENIPGNIELFWAYGGAADKRFSRDGDLGADPESSFYLKPEYCRGNEFFIDKSSFRLQYGEKCITGVFPPSSELHLSDALKQESPLALFRSEKQEAPVVTGKLKLQKGIENYFLMMNPETGEYPTSDGLPEVFDQADEASETLAGRVSMETPDEYMNAAGSLLTTAADAVWDGQSFMHGAIAWRMPLNGWRGAYAADWLGWHDRAKTHFRGYFAAQYTEPDSGPSVPDPKTHLARQKEEKGTALFTNGYISRKPGQINKPHHYDMNLVFIDQLLSHFNWTGDLDFLRESWPVLERHLAWEKRNFDGNDDGLYDAYCCIWASDALQYSGGGVTHSSAYNYRANLVAAQLAPLVGKDPAPYRAEAGKIRKAVNQQLWMPRKGWLAEYKDLLGKQLVHPSAALWTVYHAIDEGLADPFQAYQLTRYVDQYIPHIPVEAKGLPAGKYYTLSTTNWMPYTWSINNVALAEVLHMALAYWQAGRSDEAFVLAKSSLLDYMFMGTSPGNFGQLSFYDAFRGELYRDFADPIGVASRVFIEGLYGISPDLINHQLTIKPGWPAHWNHAAIETPDVKFQFKRNGQSDVYEIKSLFPEEIKLHLQLKARADKLKRVRINGQEAAWSWFEGSVGTPVVNLSANTSDSVRIEVEWEGKALENITTPASYARGEAFVFRPVMAEIIDVYDPQEIFNNKKRSPSHFEAILKGELGWRTAFFLLKQGDMKWWQPVSFELKKPVELIAEQEQPANKIELVIRNNTDQVVKGLFTVGRFSKDIQLGARSSSERITVSNEFLVPGTNVVLLVINGKEYRENLMNWNISASENDRYVPLLLTDFLNDKVTNIFTEQYYAPRSPFPTLSIPVQGIGNWCSYKENEEIDDSGLRAKADGLLTSPQGIPFTSPAGDANNILFTSQWNNYPGMVEIPLTGKASHLYLLMAGSVHHMQIQMVNGSVTVAYADGSTERLDLISPDNWWPIEQDYYNDGRAFQLRAPRPPRLYLKTGVWHLDSYPVRAKNKTLKIEGGAASLLDLPLNPDKELKSLILETNTNDVVIGLMAATLKRK